MTHSFTYNDTNHTSVEFHVYNYRKATVVHVKQTLDINIILLLVYIINSIALTLRKSFKICQLVKLVLRLTAKIINSRGVSASGSHNKRNKCLQSKIISLSVIYSVLTFQYFINILNFAIIQSNQVVYAIICGLIKHFHSTLKHGLKSMCAITQNLCY